MRNKQDNGTRLFTGVLLALLLAVPCAAQQPGFHRYGQAEGVPERQITSVFQDRHGVLWIGTYTGIVRFNGSWSDHYDIADGLPNASISCIAEDGSGRLCFGTYGGGLIIRTDDSWISLTAPKDIPDNTVVALARSADRALWIATEEGLARYADGATTQFRARQDLPFARCYEIVAAPDGALWFATDIGVVKHSGGVFTPVPFAVIPDDTYITSLVLGNDVLWGHAGGRIYRLENGVMVQKLTMPPGDAQYVNSLDLDNHNRLWIGTWDGAFMVEGESLRHYTRANGLSHNVVNRIYRDRDANLWFATEEGLSRLSRGTFVYYDGITGLLASDVLHIAEDNRGRVWVATAEGVSILDDDTWSGITTADGLADNYVTCLAPLPDGRMIIVTDSAVHEWRNGRIRILNRDLYVICIRTDSGGTVWIGSNKGLYRLSGDRFIPHAPQPLLAEVYINSIADDAQGRLWIGTNHHGCLILDGDKLEVIDGRNGFTNLDIWAVRRGVDGAMWLGTNGAGAFRWQDGQIRRYTSADGLTSDFIWQVLTDSRGGVWFGTNRGLDLLTGGRITHYTTSSGLASDEGTQDVCLEDSRGRIWFGAGRGLSTVQVYPELDEPRPVQILIEQVFIDDEPFARDARIFVKPEHRSLLIRYAGITYVEADRLLYRYRLAGIDNDWSVPRDSRSVQFSDLGPGDYRFEVAVSTDGGQSWGASPAVLQFTVEPRFYQTWWFLSLCLAAFFAAIYAGIHVRLARERVAKKKLEDIVREKTLELQARNEQLQASVQDLEAFTHMVSHDLRAPLTRIKGFLNLLKTTTDLPVDGESVTYIARVQSNCSRMDEMIRDLLRFSRSSRQSIQLEDVDLGLLARDIARNLQQADESRQVEFRFPEKLIVRSDARLIRIVLENLLDNAWKYSSKRELAVIELDCTTGSAGERVCFVRDNGVGFDQTRKDQLFALFSRLHDTADFSGLGLGLVTAQKIITRLGGRIWAESEGEEGATFYFTLP